MVCGIKYNENGYMFDVGWRVAADKSMRWNPYINIGVHVDLGEEGHRDII
jgi:hypothetical protein